MAARTKITIHQLRDPNPATLAAVKAKLDEHDNALDAVCDNTGSEHVTAAGVVAADVFLTTLAVDGTMAFTLAAGTKIGQRKLIRCKSAANTPAGTVTGTFVNGATAATGLLFNAAEDTAELVWNGTAWALGLVISVGVS
jgi:hypothetical protein